MIGDAGLPDKGSMPLRGTDDPGVGDGEVVDAEEGLDLVGDEAVGTWSSMRSTADRRGTGFHRSNGGAVRAGSHWMLALSRATMTRMAILLELTVGVASHDQFNELDDLVGESMMRAGGPPPRLLSHVVYPVADGFVVAEVWRSESGGRDYAAEILTPLIEQLGLAPSGPQVHPVWSFARP